MFCFLVMQKCVKTTFGSGLQISGPFRKLGMVLVSKCAPFRKLGMVLVSKADLFGKLGMVPSLTTRTSF
jgi:hypothetical protein